MRDAAARALRELPADRPLRALEVGGGAGGAFRRWMELVAPFPRVEFTATDRDGGLLAAYREEVRSWAGEAGWRAVGGDADAVRLEDDGRVVDVRFRRAAVPEGLAGWEAERFDLLVAQSFWDLVPPGTALALARRLLAPGGVFYAALTFSGETRFDPPHELDGPVLARYHASMEGDRGGDSRAGERLIEAVRAPGSGFYVLESGRSDWRVVPAEGGYPGDEAFFVETVLGFFEKELRDAAEIPPAARNAWLAARRRQLTEGRLGFTARQHDLAARREAG